MRRQSVSGRTLLHRYGTPAAIIVTLVLLSLVVPSNVDRATAPSFAGPAAGRVGGPGADTSASIDGGTADATGPAGSSSGSAQGADASTGGAPAASVAWGPGSWPPPGPGTQCREDRMMPDYMYGAPVCLPLWMGDNGGATAQGVTADEIKVVAYYPPVDATTEAVASTYGLSDDTENTKYQMELFRRYFNVHRETYGREVVIEIVEGGGNDAQNQRADAIRIAQEIKPFAVLFMGEANPSMAEELGARGIPCFCMNSQGRSFHRRFPGMGYSSLPTAELYYDNVADYILKKGLANGPASFAGPPPIGEPDFNDQRRFGLIYMQTTSDGTPEPSWQAAADAFKAQMAKNGTPLATSIGYRFDIASLQQQSTNIIAQLRTAKVNNVILFVDPVMPVSLTNEAFRQGYFPEWFVTGTLVTDLSFFARLYNQDQWEHAFGISPFPLLPIDQKLGAGWASYLHAGGDPNRQINFYGPDSRLATFFDGIHLAGPYLTTATFAAGLIEAPVRGRGEGYFDADQFSWVPRLDFTADDPVILSDFSELWWDRNRRGQDEFQKDGVGLYVRSNRGVRYVAGEWPTGPPQIHDADPAPVVYQDDVGFNQLPFDHGADGHTHDYDRERCRSCGTGG